MVVVYLVFEFVSDIHGPELDFGWMFGVDVAYF